jgi:hypothetical protein
MKMLTNVSLFVDFNSDRCYNLVNYFCSDKDVRWKML